MYHYTKDTVLYYLMNSVSRACLENTNRVIVHEVAVQTVLQDHVLCKQCSVNPHCAIVENT